MAGLRGRAQSRGQVRSLPPPIARARSLSLGPRCQERRDLGAFLSHHPATRGAPSEPFPRTTLPGAARLRSLSPGPPCQERRDLGAFPPNHPAVKRRGAGKKAAGPLAGAPCPFHLPPPAARPRRARRPSGPPPRTPPAERGGG